MRNFIFVAVAILITATCGFQQGIKAGKDRAMDDFTRDMECRNIAVPSQCERMVSDDGSVGYFCTVKGLPDAETL